MATSEKPKSLQNKLKKKTKSLTKNHTATPAKYAKSRENRMKGIVPRTDLSMFHAGDSGVSWGTRKATPGDSTIGTKGCPPYTWKKWNESDYPNTMTSKHCPLCASTEPENSAHCLVSISGHRITLRPPRGIKRTHSIDVLVPIDWKTDLASMMNIWCYFQHTLLASLGPTSIMIEINYRLPMTILTVRACPRDHVTYDVRENSLDFSCACLVQVRCVEPVIGVDSFWTSTGFWNRIFYLSRNIICNFVLLIIVSHRWTG